MNPKPGEVYWIEPPANFIMQAARAFKASCDASSAAEGRNTMPRLDGIVAVEIPCYKMSEGSAHFSVTHCQ